MITPWVTVPAEDVYVQLPMGLFDKDIKIMFRNVEAIDNTIAQLQNLRALLAEKEVK